MSEAAGGSVFERLGRHARIHAEGGGWSINCRKGLWGVHAPTLPEAMREAVRYFVQYEEDGEYDA